MTFRSRRYVEDTIVEEEELNQFHYSPTEEHKKELLRDILCYDVVFGCRRWVFAAVVYYG